MTGPGLADEMLSAGGRYPWAKDGAAMTDKPTLWGMPIMEDQNVPPGGMTLGDFRDIELDALRAENERLHGSSDTLTQKLEFAQDELERLRAALTEITDLELEGDASLGDAIAIADEALSPSPQPHDCARAGEGGQRDAFCEQCV